MCKVTTQSQYILFKSLIGQICNITFLCHGINLKLVIFEIFFRNIHLL